MEMTAGELASLLVDVPDEAKVIFASQPSYPMKYTISQAEIVRPSDFDEEGSLEDVRHEDEQQYVVLVEGRQEYMDSQTRRAIGW